MPKSKLTPGQIVRQRRTELGMSLERLAVTADVSSATLGRLERVDVLPKHELVLRIAYVLGIPATDLYAAASPVARAAS